ncbi:hypothetical protein ABH999_003822 [Bradyrhizobium yuanmingense]
MPPEQDGEAAGDLLHGRRSRDHGLGGGARYLVVLLQRRFRHLELADAVDDEGREALVVDLVRFKHRCGGRLECRLVGFKRGLHRRQRGAQRRRLRALFECPEPL